MASTRADNPRGEAKRTIYFPPYVFKELRMDKAGPTARTADVCVRYLWIYQSHRDELMQKFTDQEIAYLFSIPRLQGWVRPESKMNNLVRVVELELDEEHERRLPNLLKKLRDLTPLETVVLCEEMERNSIYAEE